MGATGSTAAQAAGPEGTRVEQSQGMAPWVYRWTTPHVSPMESSESLAPLAPSRLGSALQACPSIIHHHLPPFIPIHRNSTSPLYWPDDCPEAMQLKDRWVCLRCLPGCAGATSSFPTLPMGSSRRPSWWGCCWRRHCLRTPPSAAPRRASWPWGSRCGAPPSSGAPSAGGSCRSSSAACECTQLGAHAVTR